MDSSFLKLKQAIIANDVNTFDATASSIVDNAQLSNSRVDYSQADAAGYTLLHWACHLMKPLFVKKLLEFGVPVMCQDGIGKTALHRGLERAQTDPSTLMSAFLSYLTPELLALADRSGRTVLHISSMRGYEESARTMLEYGSDPLAVDVRGWTPLHFACFYDRLSVVKLLLTWSAALSGRKRQSGISVESRDGWTPLHAAATQGNDGIVSELLAQGADPNHRAFKNGQTPLHVACLNNHSACVSVLREYDADPKICDKSGLSSLACAPKEIRSVLRKTNSKVLSEPSHTSVVGMPHRPTAEREAKFAIQARDKWHRRRTQGGDFYSVNIVLDLPSDAEQSRSPSAPVLTLSPTSSRLLHEQLSGSSGSLDEQSPPISRLSPAVHNSDDPRSILKASQALSTPSVISTPPRSNKTDDKQSLPPGPATAGTSASVFDVTNDMTVPRSQSDMPRNRSLTQATSAKPNRPPTISTPPVAVKDLDSGLYILKWRPLVEGTYSISIKLRNVEIQGSPLSVVILPSKAQIPHDLRRIVNSSAVPGSPIPRTNSGISNSDEDSISRSQSTPVDLISSQRPDMTPKPTPSASTQSTPSMKKDKKGKTSKTGNTNFVISGVAVSPISAKEAPNSSENGLRKRAQSVATQKNAPEIQTQSRDRAGTVAPPNQLPTEPLKSSTRPTVIQSPNTPGDEVIPSANSSASRDRQLYRVTSTFSPLRPLGAEQPSAPDADTLAQEVQALEANLSDMHRQLASYSLRIQELETDQIISSRKYEEQKVEDRTKMNKLATALRAERDARLCKTCRSVTKNAVAIPCLHMSHCNACIEVLDKCPVCNGLLKGFITANLSDPLDNTTPR